MGSPNWSNGHVQLFLALAIMFALLTLLSVAARFYSSRIKKRRPGVDDWLIAAALVFYYIQLGVHLWGLWNGGLYEDAQYINHGQLVVLLKQLTIVQFPYAFVLTCTRIAVCVLLLRIFVQPWVKWSIYFAIFLNVSWWLFMILDAFLVCRPFAFNWDSSIKGGVCGNKNASYIANAVWGIFNDTVIWSMPHFIVWRLNTTRIRKAAVGVLFLLGIVDIVVSIVRIITLTSLGKDGNLSYELGPAEILSFAETGVAIMIASVVVCRPVFERCIPKKFLSSASKSFTKSLTKSTKKQTQDASIDDDKYYRPYSNSNGNYAATIEAQPHRNQWDFIGHHPHVTSSSIHVTQHVSIARDFSDSDVETLHEGIHAQEQTS